jgi:hypothetical protein
VLVDDMAAEDFVLIHQSAPDRPPDPALLERVLLGLRKL